MVAMLGQITGDTKSLLISEITLYPSQLFPLQISYRVKIPPDLMTDRIVLVGSTAPSLKDVFFTSYNGGLGSRDNGPIAGVEVHAQIISQIISASLDGRPLIQVWPDGLESLWIFVWTVGGAALSWSIRRPAKSGGFLLLAQWRVIFAVLWCSLGWDGGFHL